MEWKKRQRRRKLDALRSKHEQDSDQSILANPQQRAINSNLPRKRGRPRQQSNESNASKRARRVQNRRESEESKMSELAESILQTERVSLDDLQRLRDHQAFTKDPRLALIYFHCCGAHPDVFVNNDETLRNDKPGATSAKDRLLHVLDDPPGCAEISPCQQSMEAHDLNASGIYACASCCELLVSKDVRPVFTTVGELPASFRATEVEFQARYGYVDTAIRSKHGQVFEREGQFFYINPDLVHDDGVVLCQACAHDPRSVAFSIANDHDYGRCESLPELNEVAMNCITPVRRFGIEVCLPGKHLTGHAICFPSNGPSECSKMLPHVDFEVVPRVTFVGPSEQWRLQQNRFKKLYELPHDSIYAWLKVLSQINAYMRREGISVDDSLSRRHSLQRLDNIITENIVMSTSLTADLLAEAVCSSWNNDETGSSKGQTSGIQDESKPNISILRQKACVFQPTSTGSSSSDNTGAIRAMLNSLDELASDEEYDENDDTVNCAGNTDAVCAVRREKDPIVKWDSNGYLLAGAFPTLFMRGGDMLPDGSVPKRLLDHWFRYYDGRFEKNVMFVVTLFNQRQRHSAVQKAARVGVTHPSTLVKLAKLANNSSFREMLRHAKDNPKTKESKRLNARLLQIISIVGNEVPFSPFELAAARPKLSALTQRYGLAHHWVTVAPPEQDCLFLHRVAQLRNQRAWNKHDCPFTNAECDWNNLPDDVRKSARQRLSISSQYPALAALAFEAKIESVQRDILFCPSAEATRVSRDYSQRKSGAYGAVAAFGAVVEPQRDGRLHFHMTVYGSTWSPEILTRISGSDELCLKAKAWLESVSRTYLTNESHEYYERVTKHRENDPNEGRMLRPCEIDVPSARMSLEMFRHTAERCLLATNVHSHSATCIKGYNGRDRCRLNRPAGIWEAETQPIQLIWHGDKCEEKVTASPIDSATFSCIDAGYNAEKSNEFLRPHLKHPVVWELHRPARDSMIVETNLSLAILTGSHTNSAVLTSEDAGQFVDEYQQQYMTKESGGLKSATNAMLTTFEHADVYPSTAEDNETPLRQGKFLATRTANALNGGHEWPHALMVYALLGHCSYVSSDLFWYVFPHDYVATIVAQQATRKSSYCNPDAELTTTGLNDHLDGIIHDIQQERCSRQNGGDVQGDVQGDATELNQVDDGRYTPENNDGDHDSTNEDTNEHSGNARMFRIDGKVVFVTQAQSYLHRGPYFQDYSPIEFESIVDIRLCKKRNSDTSTASHRGRPLRRGFSLGTGHPLYPHYEACIRTKFKTAMLGGPPLPSYTSSIKSKVKMDRLARLILSTFTPWTPATNSLVFEFSTRGL